MFGLFLSFSFILSSYLFIAHVWCESGLFKDKLPFGTKVMDFEISLLDC
ncbi:hypothetical protein M153_3630005258 [Pseudoloma neurophilia]|uniref:Uncharacterized protein n=1 Tax=Pseudoloma neurophilia TaxID=146866 RepID=A0A0R0M4X9_9MICR|nr:hypothetical protein M153_3630005258 [Pseudoloma neurophilia]